MAKLDSWLKEDEGIRRVFFKAVWFLRGKMKISSKYLGKPLKKCVNKENVLIYLDPLTPPPNKEIQN